MTTTITKVHAKGPVKPGKPFDLEITYTAPAGGVARLAIKPGAALSLKTVKDKAKQINLPASSVSRTETVEVVIEPASTPLESAEIIASGPASDPPSGDNCSVDFE
jgi:hypothetical protein